MKLWELAEELRLSVDGNPRVVVEVETVGVMCKFGSVYEGAAVRFGGVNGRLSDVPAYLGGCDVLRIDEDILNSGETKYTIWI